MEDVVNPVAISDTASESAFHLSSDLTARAAEKGKLRKKQRTRAAILAATARELERIGYDELVVEHIVASAAIARGTFYSHFKDKTEASAAVIRYYFAMVRMNRPRGGGHLPVKAAIRRSNAFYVQVYAKNALLLAGREALMRDCPEIADLRDRLNHDWAQMVIHDLRRRLPDQYQSQDPVVVHLKIRAMIAMAEETLREIFLYRSKSMRPYADSPDLIIEVLTDYWHNSLYVMVESDAP